MATAIAAKGRAKRSAPALPEIRLSEIQDHNKCRYRHHLRWRRNIDRRVFHRPMDLGSVVHAGLAGGIRYFGHQEVRTKAIFRRSDAALVTACQETLEKMVAKLGGIKRLSSEEELIRQEIEETGVTVARRTLGALRLERWQTYWYDEKPLVEQTIRLPYNGEFIYQFTPDWVAEDLEEGGVWVLDYKIRKQFQPKEAEEVNVQFPAYQFGLGQIGLLTTGSIMVQSRAQMPSIPKLNMNGSLSRQKIATDWETYKATCLEHGLDPSDYEGDMKSKLTTEFYREDRVYRNQFVVNSFWDNLVVPAARELIAGGSTHRHMNHVNCNGCWAREFCLAELMGEDTDFLLATQYVDLNKPAPRIILRPEDFVLTD